MSREMFILCPVCEGHGTTVNPNIDGNGLTSEDFADDPDFAEDYMNGAFDIVCRAFDIVCRACNGKRVVTPDVPEKLAQAAADRRLAAREDGNFEAYCYASDHRYGY